MILKEVRVYRATCLKAPSANNVLICSSVHLFIAFQLQTLKIRLSEREAEIEVLEERLIDAKGEEDRLLQEISAARSSPQPDPNADSSLTLQSQWGNILLGMQQMLSISSLEVGFGVHEMEVLLEQLHQEVLKVSSELQGHLVIPSAAHQSGLDRQPLMDPEGSRAQWHELLVSLLDRHVWGSGLSLGCENLATSTRPSASFGPHHALKRLEVYRAASLSMRVLIHAHCRALWQTIQISASMGRGATNFQPDRQGRSSGGSPEIEMLMGFEGWVESVTALLKQQVGVPPETSVGGGSSSTWSQPPPPLFLIKRSHLSNLMSGLARKALTLWVFVSACHPLAEIFCTHSSPSLAAPGEAVNLTWQRVVARRRGELVKGAGPRPSHELGPAKEVVVAARRPGIRFASPPPAPPDDKGVSAGSQSCSPSFLQILIPEWVTVGSPSTCRDKVAGDLVMDLNPMMTEEEDSEWAFVNAC